MIAKNASLILIEHYKNYVEAVFHSLKTLLYFYTLPINKSVFNYQLNVKNFA